MGAALWRPSVARTFHRQRSNGRINVAGTQAVSYSAEVDRCSVLERVEARKEEPSRSAADSSSTRARAPKCRHRTRSRQRAMQTAVACSMFPPKNVHTNRRCIRKHLRHLVSLQNVMTYACRSKQKLSTSRRIVIIISSFLRQHHVVMSWITVRLLITVRGGVPMNNGVSSHGH